MIIYNDDADLKVSDTSVRNSLLSWVESFSTFLVVYICLNHSIFIIINVDGYVIPYSVLIIFWPFAELCITESECSSYRKSYVSVLYSCWKTCRCWSKRLNRTSWTKPRTASTCRRRQPRRRSWLKRLCSVTSITWRLTSTCRHHRRRSRSCRACQRQQQQQPRHVRRHCISHHRAARRRHHSPSTRRSTPSILRRRTRSGARTWWRLTTLRQSMQQWTVHQGASVEARQRRPGREAQGF